MPRRLLVRRPGARDMTGERARKMKGNDRHMLKPRLIALMSIVLAAAALRLAPHPPNMTPIAALALFGGAYFHDRRLAFAVPLVALLLSDLVLGFYRGMALVYLSFMLIVLLGLWLRPRRRPSLIAGAALCGSVTFFV